MDFLGGRFFKSERSLVVAGDRDICVIDPGFSYSSFREVLQHCGSFEKPVRHVVLSHAHNDHVANLKSYERVFPSLEIIVSPNSTFAKFKEARACTDGQRVRIADVDFCFLHTPGHSRKGDDISIYFPFDKLLHCGDLAQPQGDCWEHATFASPVPFYYDGDAYLKSIDALLSLDFKVLMTGHGDMLSESRGRNWLNVTKRVIEQSRDVAYKLIRENSSESDSRIAEWVFRTIANARSLNDASINERMCEVDGISDYELYDLPGIQYWVQSARKRL
ncbi:MBL fold metallo-hydrolase [Candidatus Woesearchaeota archaeon]|nr:MBL fold metallo-hydrolase [Candidatus Woesearchaeota archaeon]